MITAIIPARSGSKGVPNKNMRTLYGHTLIDWAITSCKKSKLINEVLVSTDSEEYRDHALSKGAKVPFLRPKEISNDFSTDFEFINHALDWFKENTNEPEIIALIRPTTPIRDPKIIDDAINKFSELDNITSLRSVHEMSESSYKTFEISENGHLNSICSNSFDLDQANMARQSFPNTYVGNGYIDLFRSKFIRKEKLLYGNRVYAYITPVTWEVDHENDFEILNYQLSRKSSLLSKLFD